MASLYSLSSPRAQRLNQGILAKRMAEGALEQQALQNDALRAEAAVAGQQGAIGALGRNMMPANVAQTAPPLVGALDAPPLESIGRIGVYPEGTQMNSAGALGIPASADRFVPVQPDVSYVGPGGSLTETPQQAQQAFVEKAEAERKQALAVWETSPEGVRAAMEREKNQADILYNKGVLENAIASNNAEAMKTVLASVGFNRNNIMTAITAITEQMTALGPNDFAMRNVMRQQVKDLNSQLSALNSLESRAQKALMAGGQRNGQPGGQSAGQTGGQAAPPPPAMTPPPAATRTPPPVSETEKATAAVLPSRVTQFTLGDATYPVVTPQMREVTALAADEERRFGRISPALAKQIKQAAATQENMIARKVQAEAIDFVSGLRERGFDGKYIRENLREFFKALENQGFDAATLRAARQRMSDMQKRRPKVTEPEVRDDVFGQIGFR
jgi:hypothetical protein